MKKVFRTGFVLVMIAAILLVIWYIPVSQSLRFNISETEKELDTSMKREEKQRYEYDEVIAELPLVRADLAEKQPLAEAAAAEVTELKAERKALRAEKAALESASATGEEAVSE